ncbi:YhbP family protein [Ewingella sp. S1.OA.A_B6]
MNDADDVKHIGKFLGKHHVLALCATADGDMWSANCFYVADISTMTLYFMSELKTLHGTLMHKNPQVVGTIAPAPKTIALIKGIQYRGDALILTGEEETAARYLYCQHFPIAATMKAPVWALKLNQIKMTDNTLGFGKKLFWTREAS